MKKILLTLSFVAVLSQSMLGEIVYLTACVSNCPSGAACQVVNPDLNGIGLNVYLDEGGYGAYTSAKAGTADKVAVAGSRYHSTSFSNSTPDIGIVLSPSLAVTGGVYKVYHVYSSTAGNVSTNLIVAVTNVEGCTLSWTNTDKFQRSFGQPSPQSWQFLGYLTNNLDTAFPRIRFYFADGVVSAGASQRLVIEQFKFVYYDYCTDVPEVTVSGPLSTNSNQVLVRNVSVSATNVTVFQDTGAGMAQVGKRTSGVVAGNNYVTVSGLVKGAKVAATQTINGVDGCTPQAGFGIQVGGGANPRLRLALSIKENPTAAGPVGANGAAGANSNIHFIPANNVLGGSCPGDGTIVIYPSNDWQTVTVPGRQSIGDSGNAAGTAASGSGYLPNDSVTMQVYAYKSVPDLGVTIYSATAAQSAAVTSNDVFVVNWTWDTVAGAEGYRLLRDVNSGGYNEYVDLAVNSYTDAGNNWVAGNTVTPTTSQGMPSIMWNPTVGNADNIVGTWGVLEAIALASDDLSDNGPFNIYLDDLANGTNGVFQDFEGFVATTPAGVVFNQPSYSGTTSGNILPTPNDGAIAGEAAYAGTKSQRVGWQFASGATNLWIRYNTFNTSVMPNPLVNLDQPISFKILVLPVGASPTNPLRPAMTVSVQDGKAVLTWPGAHRLQASSDVTGVYTNTGVTAGPWTNTFVEPQKFFRLKD
jgi:hypothetical protein